MNHEVCGLLNQAFRLVHDADLAKQVVDPAVIGVEQLPPDERGNNRCHCHRQDEEGCGGGICAALRREHDRQQQPERQLDPDRDDDEQDCDRMLCRMSAFVAIFR